MALSATPTHRDLMLQTRRALLGDPLSLQVHEWLRPLYVGPIGRVREAVARTTISASVAILGKMVSTLDPEVKKKSTVHKALTEVADFISAPLAPQYADAFDLVKRSKVSVAGTFVSVVYARALVLLLSSTAHTGGIVRGMTGILANPTSVIDD